MMKSKYQQSGQENLTPYYYIFDDNTKCYYEIFNFFEYFCYSLKDIIRMFDYKE